MTDTEDDAVMVLRALAAGHPTLTYVPPAGDGEHLATWMEDDGPHTVRRDTAGQLAAAMRARFGEPDEHEAAPEPDTIYSVGPYNGTNRANLRNALHYPVEAMCLTCHKRIVCDRMVACDWKHEARMTEADASV